MSNEVNPLESEKLFDAVEPVVDAPVDMKYYPPTMGEHGWTDYVLSQLAEDEIFDGKPTTAGLRRLAEKYLGEIVEFDTQVVAAPSEHNLHRATVIVRLVFERLITSGAADVFSGNCDPPFSRFPVSTAETRAEGRALKRALRLSKVVTIEEVSKAAGGSLDLHTTPENDDDKPISETQIRYLEILAQKTKVNLQKFVLSHYPNLTSIANLKNSETKALQQLINDYQQNPPPSDLVGYDPNWRVLFL